MKSSYERRAKFILDDLAKQSKPLIQYSMEYYALVFNVINALEYINTENATLMRGQIEHGYFEVSAPDLEAFVKGDFYRNVKVTNLYNNTARCSGNVEACAHRMESVTTKNAGKVYIDLNEEFRKAYLEDMYKFAKDFQQIIGMDVKNIQDQTVYEALLCCLGLFGEAYQQVKADKTKNVIALLNDFLKNKGMDKKSIKKDRNTIFHADDKMPKKNELQDRALLLSFAQKYLEKELKKSATRTYADNLKAADLVSQTLLTEKQKAISSPTTTAITTPATIISATAHTHTFSTIMPQLTESHKQEVETIKTLLAEGSFDPNDKTIKQYKRMGVSFDLSSKEAAPISEKSEEETIPDDVSSKQEAASEKLEEEVIPKETDVSGDVDNKEEAMEESTPSSVTTPEASSAQVLPAYISSNRIASFWNKSDAPSVFTLSKRRKTEEKKPENSSQTKPPGLN